MSARRSLHRQMADRYSAFSFVDRITSLEPGSRARGLFQVPSSLPAFPPSLAAEAIGQLAAWLAMDHLDYRLRPVAGIAAEARFRREVAPGSQLELEVEIDSCSDSDVAYGGRARVNGQVTVELSHCLGPMLPMEEFDSPADVRERFKLLCGPGAPAGRFAGLPDLVLTPIERLAGEKLTARLQIPGSAPFFGDHFPRRPVFPATLLLNAQMSAVLDLAVESGHWPAQAAPSIRRVQDVKVRAFMPPGEELEIRVTLAPPADGIAVARITTLLEGRRVAHARAEIGPREENN